MVTATTGIMVMAARTHCSSRRAGTDSGTCGQASDPCLTIGQAVSNASDGNRIIVLPGTYAEMVTVDKSLSLQGTHVTIDATGQNNGILLQGPGASGSSVRHFTRRERDR